jgi:hypothetical protein
LNRLPEMPVGKVCQEGGNSDCLLSGCNQEE